MKLPKVYEPNQYESDIYELWEKAGAFKPVSNFSKYYSVVMPPPNANANSHLGHSLTVALEDIAVRYHRLKGDNTLLVPGADHAGFETWVVYEKHLNKQGKTRFDYSREELYSQVWDFVELNKNNLINQLRKMGISADWDRFTFTLDEKVVNQAYSSFKQMWHDRLVYRGERLVNYCTFHGTSFSDIEVVYKTEQGRLWYINYPLEDGSGHITVATSRPETMLGDTAVAINPKDKRYAKYLGKTIKLPLVGRDIPIIADEMVDIDFGTGAVKITPAHDPNDYEVAQRHSLPMISVITTKGNMADNLPERYRELPIDEARRLIVKDLKEQGNLVKEEVYSHRVGHCYKCNTVIQPLLKDQWFVSMKPLAQKAIEHIEAGNIKFYPKTKQKQAIEYLKNIRDWNISRQIPWGIPIPAFQNVNDPDDWIYDERVEQETITFNNNVYRRDPDVFDTWFSSGQWPYVTLGYPDGPDFSQFYPLSLMETGGEIFYQWVCRMIMMGLYITGKVPFESVYIHGHVMADDGSKMSKSLGNVVDPIPVIESYGSDALRMGIISGRVAAVNRSFDMRRVQEARNFGNKLWNIARFIEDSIGDDFQLRLNQRSATSQDEWILWRIQEANKNISNHLDNYRFNEAFEQLYHLIWDDFADWYLETSKHELNKSVLAYGLETILKLAHPFAPFLTETIWQTLRWESDSLLITSSWPVLIEVDKQRAKDFEKLKEVVTEIRFVKGKLKLGKQLKVVYGDDSFIKMHAHMIKSLVNLDSVDISDKPTGLRLNSSKDCWLDLDEKTLNNFLSELKSQIKSEESAAERLRGRLANKSYVDNAPKKIVEETKEQLDRANENILKMRTQYEQFTK
jgi:valyl-tRNA synthetase